MTDYHRELRVNGDLVALARGLYGALDPGHGLDLTTRQRERRNQGVWGNDGVQEGSTRWELGDDHRGLALVENVEVRDHHAVFAHYTTTTDITSRGLPAGRSLRLLHDSRRGTLTIDVHCPTATIAEVDRIVRDFGS